MNNANGVAISWKLTVPQKVLRYILNKTEWKMSKYEVLSITHFPVFELNKKIYSVNIYIQ